MPDATILVVDDEEELAQNLADLLEFEGYTTQVCSSGEQALEKVVVHPPDLVLLDIQLPGIDGLETLRRLKEAHPTIPVLMVSASSKRGTMEQVKKFGADGLILKPYDQDELLALIERTLRKVDR
jgi:DNA-binding response OmpR family regulator